MVALPLALRAAPTDDPAAATLPDARNAAKLDEARSILDPTLRSIESAVRTADPAAYLAWVDLAESHFAKEQRNWAADLLRHRPEAFELRIVGLIEHDNAAGRARDTEIVCDLEMSWSIPAAKQADGGHAAGADADSREPTSPVTTTGGPGLGGWSRTVRFPARFTLSEQTDASDPIDEPRWLFAGEAWLTVRSDDGRNTVCYAEGFEDAAKRVLALLPTARRRVDRLFGMNLEHEQVVKLYPDARWLLASIYLSYKDPIGGWNEPGESIKLLARRTMNERATLALLAHEYGHVATFEFDEHASDAAWWAVEGIAEVCATFAARSELDDDAALTANTRFIGRTARSRVLAWHRGDRLADWNDMADFRKTPSSLGGHVYKQGEHMVGFIGERFGREKMIEWVRELAVGATVDDATRRTLGLSFDALDARWRELIREEADSQREDADAPDESPAPATPPTTAPNAATKPE
ncbi:MAG: hypothetical protein KF768_03495 [Phycisphaeraceae bacterium]|nr:hypothetical protein [Phycisphaeraceae bacterium]